MRQWTCLAVTALGLGLLAGGALSNREAACAAPIMPGTLSSTGLITHVQELEGKLLRLVVIDPAQRVIGVYDVGRDTGEIQLKSIRNIQADLQMLGHNSEDPSPAEIKNSLGRR